MSSKLGRINGKLSLVKKPTARQETRSLSEQITHVRGQVQMLASKFEQDVKLIDRRSMEWWEHLWAAVEAVGKKQEQQTRFNQYLVEVLKEICQLEFDFIADTDVGTALKKMIDGLAVLADVSPLKESDVANARHVVVARWRVEALESLKNELTPGEAVCTRCHYVDGGPAFFVSPEKSDESLCPNCKTPNTAFLKDTEVVSSLKLADEVDSSKSEVTP